MLPRSLLRLAAALCVWAAISGAAHAQFYFITDHAGYTGSWGYYKTLADAQSGQNLVSSGAIPQRNLGIYVTRDLYPPSGGPPNSSIITTNWYSSTNGTPGTGNTSNTSLGFFQLYNDPTNAKTSSFAFWDQSLSSFTMSESGTGVKGAPGFESRFSPLAGLGFVETQGEYLSYAFTATASGLNGVPNGGVFEDNAGIATGFSGAFNAIFQNTGGNPALEGFYAINLNFNNSTTLDGSFTNFINPSNQFAGATVIPEPTSVVAFGMIFAASAGFGWRKSRQRRSQAVA
jgi:hypothetical protein